ncbi:MAG: MBL fold metallo-hydrolase [Candidatus Omnitrophica bacterium]|nr:MBL fold metallo-hydrolase [Candidatus Omnitrophota bacterium]
MSGAEAPSLYFKQIPVGYMQNFAYLIGDKKTGECAVVDPAWDVDAVLREAEADGMKVVACVLTHTHFDHCNGVETLVERTGAKVYVHEKEAPYLKELKPYLVLTREGSTLKIGLFAMTFLHTPGHTEGSQCLLVGDRLVTGDTLFVGACGRCDLPGGDGRKMQESLKRLAGLDASLKVYPGHAYGEPSSTIGEQKRTNPFMK